MELAYSLLVIRLRPEPPTPARLRVRCPHAAKSRSNLVACRHFTTIEQETTGWQEARASGVGTAQTARLGYNRRGRNRTASVAGPHRNHRHYGAGGRTVDLRHVSNSFSDRRSVRSRNSRPQATHQFLWLHRPPGQRARHLQAHRRRPRRPRPAEDQRPTNSSDHGQRQNRDFCQSSRAGRTNDLVAPRQGPKLCRRENGCAHI